MFLSDIIIVNSFIKEYIYFRLLEVKPSVKQVATVARLIALYNNYDPDTTHVEVITSEERKEESDLLDSFLNTPIWDYTYNFLKSKGKYCLRKGVVENLCLFNE